MSGYGGYGGYGGGGYYGAGDSERRDAPTRSTRREKEKAKNLEATVNWGALKAALEKLPSKYGDPAYEHASLYPHLVNHGILDSAESAQDEAKDLAKRKEKLEYYVGEVVNCHHLAFNHSILNFTKILEQFNKARETLEVLKKDAVKCEAYLNVSTDKIRQQWLQDIQYQEMNKIFTKIDELRRVPALLSQYVSGNHFVHASTLLVESLDLVLQPDISQVGAMDALREDLFHGKDDMYSKILEQIQGVVYLQARVGDQSMGANDEDGMLATVARTRLRRDSIMAPMGASDRKMQKAEMDGADLLSTSRTGWEYLGGSYKNTIMVDSLGSKGAVGESVHSNPASNPEAYLRLLVEALHILDRAGPAHTALKRGLSSNFAELIEAHFESFLETGGEPVSSHIQLGGVSGPSLTDKSKSVYVTQYLDGLFDALLAVIRNHLILLNIFEKKSNSSSIQEESDGPIFSGNTLYNGQNMWQDLQMELLIMLHDHLGAPRPSREAGSNFITSSEVNVTATSATVKAKTSVSGAGCSFAFADSEAASVSRLSVREPGTEGQLNFRNIESSLFESGPYHILVCYKPTVEFVHQANSLLRSSRVAVQSPGFLEQKLDEYVDNFFLPKMTTDFRMRLAKVLDDRHAFLPKETGCAMSATTEYQADDENRPLLQGAVEIANHIQELMSMAVAMPKYLHEMMAMVENTLLRFLDKCTGRFREAFEDVAAGEVLGEPGVDQLLTRDPSWLALRKSHRTSDVSMDPKKFTEEELKLELPLFLKMDQSWKTISPGDYTLLANLNDSFEWLGERVRQLCRDGSHKIKDDLLRSFGDVENLVEKCSALSERCLLLLRMDIRTRVAVGLSSVRKSSYAFDEVPNMPDTFILDLNADLINTHTVLSQYLPAPKLKYCLEGIGDLASVLLRRCIRHIRVVNDNGVIRMCRNITAMHQNLIHIRPDIGSGDFDKTRRYYELLKLDDQDLLSFTSEHQRDYTMDEYEKLFAVETPRRQNTEKTLAVLSHIFKH